MKQETIPGKYFDGGGLFLLIEPNGTKRWRLKYRIGGVERLLAIGTFPKTSLANARDAREAARKLIAEGKDPNEAKRERVATELAASDALKRQAHNSFENVAREWFAASSNKWSPDHAQRVMRGFEADVFPIIGERPINAIEPIEVLRQVLKPIEKRDATEYLQRIKRRIAAVFRFAVANSYTRLNPVSEIGDALKVHKTQNYARIAESELPQFLKDLNAYKGHKQTALAMRLLMLTFVRTGGMRFATWEEFDFDKAQWRIPAERMKMDKPHIVPLSTQALDVLEGLKAFNQHRRLIVTNLHDPEKPMSENTINKALEVMGYKKRMTGHGFRGLASTILNEHGFAPDWIERQLAHGDKNSVRAAYNHAQYLPQRTKMMQAWADMLDVMRNDNNKVVSGRFNKVA